MDILVLNWRDPKNPRSGGAEILNLHILKPLVAIGNRVTWYSMAVPGLPSHEKYCGISIIRHGNLVSHFLSWPVLYHQGQLGKADIIIDCVHGSGYWATLLAPSKKVFILVCEVAQDIWKEMWPFPINILGQVYEKFMYYYYSGKDYWTISNSTKNDLIRYGISKENISILPMGYDAVKISRRVTKSSVPTALFVGRICAMKGIRDAILAVSHTKSWQLVVIGRGEAKYEQKLKNLIKQLKLTNRIFFKGFVSEAEKFNYYASSWVLLVPSIREGWGMIVPEANSAGTPAVGYDVPGLRDVLPYYSQSNRIIHPDPVTLTQTLNSINSPLSVSDVKLSGWSELEKFVLSSV